MKTEQQKPLNNKRQPAVKPSIFQTAIELDVFFFLYN